MMDMLGLNQTIDKMAKASGVRWLGRALRKEDDDVVRNALNFNVGDEEREDNRKELGESK